MSPRSSLAAAAVGVALAVLAAAPPATAGHHAQVVSITIRAGDRIREPNIAVAPGVRVRLTVVNYTREFHTFTVPGLGVSALIKPMTGATPRATVVTFTPQTGGVYVWHCAICPSGQHGMRHEMTGALYAIVDVHALP